MIKFTCGNCGQEISISEIHAGKRVKCSKCEHIIVVPEAENLQSFEESDSSTLEIGPRVSEVDLSIFDIPQTDPDTAQPITQDVSGGLLEDVMKSEQRPPEEELESIGRRRLPWIIDIFLYPMSFWGLINLAIFIGVPLLIDILSKVVPFFLTVLFGLVSSVVEIIIVLYMYWYLAECIRDSAEGGLRAPKVIGDVPGVADMFWQMINIAGCLIVFFAPFVLYMLFTKKAGVIFWLLLIYAVFFFPMALLAIVVLDSVSGLDPRLIYKSIANTFRQYLALVLLFVAAVILIGVLGPKVEKSIGWAFLFRCACIYLLFVAAHLLGRFYWRYQEKLNWKFDH